MKSTTLIRFAGAAAAVLMFVGCGGSTPPPKAAPQPDDARPPSHAVVPEVSAEIGALSEDDVTRTFASCMGGLQQCLDAGAKRVEYLGGSVGFAIKVDQSGHLSDARIDQSTLGDHQTEQCMLDVLKAKSWPKPVGGKTGLASKSFDFDPPNDVRAPTDWSSDRIGDALSKLSSKISDCKKSSSGNFTATMYVDTSGKALSVGVAPPDTASEGAVDCLVEVLESAKYPSPGSWPAKVTFTL
jgi:hypothetical protein